MARSYRGQIGGSKHDKTRARADRRAERELRVAANREYRKELRLNGIDPLTLPESFQGLARTLARSTGLGDDT